MSPNSIRHVVEPSFNLDFYQSLFLNLSFPKFDPKHLTIAIVLKPVEALMVVERCHVVNAHAE